MADGFQTLPDLNAIAMQRRSFNVAELDAMFDANILSHDEKIELIDGEIVQMSSQLIPHSVLKSNLLGYFYGALSHEFRVTVELSVQLDQTTLLDPDVSITRRVPIL